MLKLVKVTAALELPTASVTVIVQSLYVPSANTVVLSVCVNVMVVLPELIKPSSVLPQLPPTLNVPALVVDIVTSGVVSILGVNTAVTSATIGTTESTNTPVVAATLFKVKDALLAAVSFIVPPFAAKLPIAIPSLSFSPACTV